MNEPTNAPATLHAVVLDCPDPPALAQFYIRLLGWKKTYDEGDEWVELSAPTGGVMISFQKNELYVPPVWPEEPGTQQQMAHLDFIVPDKQEMKRAAQYALDCGAAMAGTQYSDRWVTLIDPAGHPFCFVLGSGWDD